MTPNELAAERPYIEHNIRMTREAYLLDGVEEKEFAAEESLSAAALERNSITIKNIRLWDHRPLLTTYGKLQEIRTYYKFLDVDVDRYTVNGEYRQVMLSARELSYKDLPSRGWINERLTYTHGYGLVASPVNRISPEGLAGVLPARTSRRRAAGLPKVTRPEIYYGELGNDYVIVRTRSQELDYPVGRPERLRALRRASGGIPVNSLLAKLAFALRFGEIKMLLSDDLTPESRVMIYRDIGARVRQAAPFLRFDRDPYLIVTEAGRLVWMIDGYTTSERYPYSQPVRGLQLHPQLGEGRRGRLRRDGELLHRGSRRSDRAHLRAGVSRAPQAAPGHARRSPAPHPLSRGPLRRAGDGCTPSTTCRTRRSSTTRRTSGRSRACPRRKASGRWSRTSRSCGCPASPARSSSSSPRSTRAAATT